MEKILQSIAGYLSKAYINSGFISLKNSLSFYLVLFCNKLFHVPLPFDAFLSDKKDSFGVFIVLFKNFIKGLAVVLIKGSFDVVKFYLECCLFLVLMYCEFCKKKEI